MKERPIIFSAPMVRAILKGCKTQTRRVVKPIPAYPDAWEASMFKEPQFSCPYGSPGDRLWVRETWATSIGCDGKKPSILETPGHGYGWPVWFRADDSVWWRGASKGGPAFMTRGKWRPSIHMPRWACRDVYTVTKVRLERLQAITREDAIAEGVNCAVELEGNSCADCGSCADSDLTAPIRAQANPRASFAALWERLNGKKPGCSWAANPWVWVIEYNNPEVGRRA